MQLFGYLQFPCIFMLVHIFSPQTFFWSQVMVMVGLMCNGDGDGGLGWVSNPQNPITPITITPPSRSPPFRNCQSKSRTNFRHQTCAQCTQTGPSFDSTSHPVSTIVVWWLSQHAERVGGSLTKYRSMFCETLSEGCAVCSVTRVTLGNQSSA